MTNQNISWEERVEFMLSKFNPVPQGFKYWLVSKKELGNMFDYLLYMRCFNISKSLRQDFDHFTVISGMEGTGKSTLATQVCAAISPTYKLENICFDLSDFIKILRKCNVGDSIQLDEGNMFLFSREAMSQDNRMMTKLFAIMRQKSLHILICVPNFFTIDSYIRDHRVSTLIQITKRGKYTAYTGKAIRIISKEGSRFKQIIGLRVPYGTFWEGYFTKSFPVINDINEDTYREYKAKHMEKYLDEMEETIKSQEITSNLMPLSEASRLLPHCITTIKKFINSGKIPGKKIGRKYFVDKNYIKTGEIPEI